MTARARALSSRLQAARPAVAYAAVSVAPPVILPINTEAGTTLVIDFATRAPVPSVELDMPQPLLVLVAPMIEREPKPAGARMGMLASTAAHGLILVALVIGPLLVRDVPAAGGEQAITVEFLVVSPNTEDLVEGAASSASVNVELPAEIEPPTQLALPNADVPPPPPEPADILAQFAALPPPVVATPKLETPPPPPENAEIIEPALLQPVLLNPDVQAPPKPPQPDQKELRRQQSLRNAVLKAQQDKRDAQAEAKQDALDLAREKRERAREAASRKAAALAAIERRQTGSLPVASTSGQQQASRPAAAGRAGTGQAAETAQRGGATNGAAASAGAAQVASWRARVIAHLARFKRYPTAAEEREITGRSGLVFTLSKSGQVIGVSLTASSGHGMLDQEALAMVRRAAPFPAAPTGSPATHSFNTAVRFDIR